MFKDIRKSHKGSMVDIEFFSMEKNNEQELTQIYKHRNFEIVICTKGGLDIYEGKKNISIYEGDVYIINCDIAHQIKVNEQYDVCQGYLIQIDFFYINKLVPNIKKIEIKQPKDEVNNALYRGIKELVTHFQQNHPYLNVYVNGMLGIITFIILDELTDLKEDKSTKYTKRTLEILDYLEGHYNEDLEFEEVAMKFNMSSGHFYKIFKDQLGITPKEYLTNLRLNHVAIELMETDKTIIDIAFSNGFTNIKSFYTLFKREYGMLPTEYRKKTNR